MNGIDNIAQAISQELHERMESGEIITHWVVLAAIHGADDDGEVPGSAVIRSERDMALRTELGLLEERKMHIQALITHSLLQDGDE